MVHDTTMGGHVRSRILTHQKWHFGRRDLMNCGENLTALMRHQFARCREAFVTDNSRSQRFSCHPFGNVTIAELVRSVDYGQHSGRWGAGTLRRDHQSRLIGGTDFRGHACDRVANVSAELNNQFKTLLSGICIEGDCRTIGTASEALEIMDRAGLADMAYHGSLEPAQKFVSVHFGVAGGMRVFETLSLMGDEIQTCHR
jgi:hypothetical protein